MLTINHPLYYFPLLLMFFGALQGAFFAQYSSIIMYRHYQNASNHNQFRTQMMQKPVRVIDSATYFQPLKQLGLTFVTFAKWSSGNGLIFNHG